MPLDSESTARLCDRILSGDEAAFAVLVEETHQDLRCFVAAHAWTVDTIDEVVQATYIACFEGLARFRPENSLLAWLKGIARNHLRRAADEWRRRSRHCSDALEALESPAAEPELDCSESAEHQAGRLAQCLERAGPLAQRLLAGFYQQGLSLAALAAQEGRSRAAVAMNLSRIRAVLRSCLEGLGGEGAGDVR